MRAVEPVSATNARRYAIKRASRSGGPFSPIATDLTGLTFEDTTATRGYLYRYVVTSSNAYGESGASAELAATFGLPGEWMSEDVGAVDVDGFTEYDGDVFSLEGHGRDIGGVSDSFHFAHHRMTGDGTITARVVLPMSSQWTKPGVMVRESLAANARHASALLLPPYWRGALVTRGEPGGETREHGKLEIGEPYVEKKNRLLTPYWVRLARIGNTFTAWMSPDGRAWKKLAAVDVPMAESVVVGLPACSQLRGVTTTATYDRVSVPGWSMSAK